MENKFWKGLLSGVVATVIGGTLLNLTEDPVKTLGKPPKKRLTYSVGQAINIYTQPPETNLLVTVLTGTNQFPVKNLFGYKVKVWNSGAEPLTNLSVQFHLSTNSSFYCLADVHSPKPSREVGNISPEVVVGHQGIRSYKYELLNPNHSDEVFFVTNMESDIEVVARDAGLLIERASPQAASRRPLLAALALGVCVGAAVSFFVKRNARDTVFQRAEIQKQIQEALERVELLRDPTSPNPKEEPRKAHRKA